VPDRVAPRLQSSAAPRLPKRIAASLPKRSARRSQKRIAASLPKRSRRGVLSGVTPLLLLAACSFEHAEVPSGGIGGSGGGGEIDAGDMSGADAMLDAAPPFCDPTDTTLRACYELEGNTLDGSSYHHNISASSVAFQNGHRGLGLSTKSGTYTVAASTGLDVTALTIKLWIKPNNLPSDWERMGLIDSASRWRLFVAPDGALRCSLTGGIDFTTPPSKVTVGSWQRVACTFDGVLMRIYVDGVQAGQKTGASAFPTPGTGMVVGHNNPSGENFDGMIDDVQIFGAVVAP
jgi:hypothetical protein